MFVPVVTKDMQLFPGNRQQLPARIKNVRSRAQSLEDNMNNAMNNHALTNGSAAVAAANAAAIAARSRIVPAAKQRNAQSVGSLPTSASLALAPASRSPPKLSSASMRKPLDPIVEGVPLASAAPASNCSAKPLNKKKRESNNNEEESPVENKENPSSSSSCTTPSSNKSTPDLQELRIRPTSSLSTASAPGLDKSGTSPGNSNSSSSGKGIVKWITNTLKGKNGSSSSSKDKEKDCSNNQKKEDLPLLVDDMDNEKPWRSLGNQEDGNKS